MKSFLLLILFVTAALAAPAPDQHAYLPDPKLTPGKALPGIAAKDLVAGYAGKTRNVPDSEKVKIYAEYHITAHRPGEYEIDHLISLELGGSNEPENLWPQPYAGLWNAHLKDKLENELHRRVVAGRMDLADVQHRISADWIALYRQVFPELINADGTPKSVGPQPNAEPDK